MKYSPLLIIIVLFSAQTVDAALLINEVAWPLTIFAIVLIGMLYRCEVSLARTEGWQKKCLGKMGVIGICICFPAVSQAAVIINEIAWMGSGVSANDEWIELYNSGTTAVTVDGWILEDTQSLRISLMGTVGAGQYAVLERTDDESAPGTAFLIYTGGLVNTGTTLRLRDGSSAIVDQVAGGENWESIGGDNTTKETAQHTPAGWITALATPGSVNATEDTGSDEPETTSSQSSSKTVAYPVTRIETKEAELEFRLRAPTIAYVNQPIEFDITLLSDRRWPRSGLRQTWNFGDLTTSHERTVSHRYAFPGTYVVTAEIRYEGQTSIARHEITVLPVDISLTLGTEGVMHINNDAPYDIEVGGYAIRDGQRSIVFPAHTIIKTKGTITLPAGTFADASAIMLFDAADQVVASRMPNWITPAPLPLAQAVVTQSVATPAVPVPFVATPTPTGVVAGEYSFASDDLFVPEAQTTSSVPRTPSSAVVRTTSPAAKPTYDYSRLGLVGILLLAIGGLYAKRYAN